MKKLLVLLWIALMTIACSKKENPDPEPDPEPTKEVVIYTDINFAVKHGDATYARFFSTGEGKSYKDSEVNATTGPKIDLAFEQDGPALNYFLSPLHEDVGMTVPGAKATKFKNYITNQMTVAEFDALTKTDFDKLTAITVNDDGESFPTSSLPRLVFFENAAGKKGIIKIKSFNTSRLLADIKVQK